MRTGGCRAQEDAARRRKRTQEDTAHRRTPRTGGCNAELSCARPASLTALQQLLCRSSEQQDIAGRAHDAAQPGHICTSWQNKDFAAVL